MVLGGFERRHPAAKAAFRGCFSSASDRSIANPTRSVFDPVVNPSKESLEVSSLGSLHWQMVDSLQVASHDARHCQRLCLSTYIFHQRSSCIIQPARQLTLSNPASVSRMHHNPNGHVKCDLLSSKTNLETYGRHQQYVERRERLLDSKHEVVFSSQPTKTRKAFIPRGLFFFEKN